MSNTEKKNEDMCASKENMIQKMQFILQARPYLELESYKVNLPVVLTSCGCPFFSFAKDDLDAEEIPMEDGEFNYYTGFSIVFYFKNRSDLLDSVSLGFVDGVEVLDHDGNHLLFNEIEAGDMYSLEKSGDRLKITAWFYFRKTDARNKEEIEAEERKLTDKYFEKEERLYILMEATNGFVRETFHTEIPMMFDGKEHKIEDFRKDNPGYWISGERCNIN